jgi:energy-coupling factor transport system ATP-binding protein
VNYDVNSANGQQRVPDYVKICNALKEKGYTDRDIEITEEPTVELVKEALKG